MGLGAKVIIFLEGRFIFLPFGRVIIRGFCFITVKTPKRRSSARESVIIPLVRVSRVVFRILDARL